MNADDIICILDLKPHPREGGYFREIYRSAWILNKDALPPGYSADRAVSTAIYYLLTPTTCSRMHRIQSDEVFHFYWGDPVEMIHLAPDGTAASVVLGNDLQSGQRPQIVVPANVWQGARLKSGGRCALLGTTVAPGFDFADYENGDRKVLTAAFPAFAKQIEELTPA